ncbi:hypothetical protein PVAP13_6NG013731 [Panicum virgatum]|uniref:Uncharacterized protein n=1 Tax=Panicum virgatum TaxID=38727 RepID=A0A8T0QT54_PANVG|nr:hypothetical protein PVAP13_6NG013731 [Panicum virgatum]
MCGSVSKDPSARSKEEKKRKYIVRDDDAFAAVSERTARSAADAHAPSCVWCALLAAAACCSFADASLLIRLTYDCRGQARPLSRFSSPPNQPTPVIHPCRWLSEEIEGGAQECADVQGICSHKKNFRQMFLVKRHKRKRGLQMKSKTAD